MRQAFFLFLGLISLLANSVNAAYSVPPKSWYFTLDDGLAQTVEEKFGIKIDSGLYFTDQREARGRSDLRTLVKKVTVDLDPGIYCPGTKEGEPCSADIGFSSKSSEQKELWLIKSNKERYKLHGPTDANRFMGTPEYFIPVRDGVMAFAKDWVTFRRHQSNNKKIADTIKLRVYTRTFGDGANAFVQPAMVHNQIHNKILLAAWDQIPADPENAPAPKYVTLYMVDLERDTATPILNNLSWPFYLDFNGVYYVNRKDKKLEFRDFNWEEETIAEPAKAIWEFDPQTDKLEVAPDEFYYVTKNADGLETKYNIASDGKLTEWQGKLQKFEEISAQEDEGVANAQGMNMIEALAIGEEDPLYSIDSVTQWLASVLGASEKTWGILVYDEGTLAEDLVSSFVWELHTKGIRTTPSLKDIEKVYKFDGSREPFDTDDQQKLVATFEALRDASDGRRSIIYLKDFPTTLREKAEHGNAKTNLETFFNVFRDCSAEGACRVVMTMPKPVYSKIASSLPDIFSKAQVRQVPEISKMLRIQVAKNLRERLEQKYTKKFEPMAFDQFLQYAHGMGRKSKSPGNEKVLLTKLFDYVLAEHNGSFEITTAVLRGFVDNQRGVADIKSVLDVDGLRAFLKKKIVGHDAEIDRICDQLLPVVNGTHFSSQPLAFITLLGTVGVGKTYMAKLIAEYVTGSQENLVLINGKAFEGFDAESDVYKTLHASQDQLKIVLFDDIDQGTEQAQNFYADIVHEGYYAQGTKDQLAFSNWIVMFTANWGQELIMEGDTTDVPLRTRLRRYLLPSEADIKNGAKKIVHERFFSRIENSIVILKPFTEEQLFELAVTLTQEEATQLAQSKGIELVVDPRILIKIDAAEDIAQAGARSIKNRLFTDVYPVYNKLFQRKDASSIKQIVLYQHNDRIIALCNLDGNIFVEAWTKVQKIYQLPIEEIVKQYGGEK